MYLKYFITLNDSELWGIIAALIFMAFDIISGLICAVVRRDFNSSKMRDGIGHKTVLLLVIIMALLAQGFAEHIPGFDFTMPLVLPVCLYIILMELASFLETIKLTYPKLSDTTLFNIFNIKDRE